MVASHEDQKLCWTEVGWTLQAENYADTITGGYNPFNVQNRGFTKRSINTQQRTNIAGFDNQTQLNTNSINTNSTKYDPASDKIESRQTRRRSPTHRALPQRVSGLFCYCLLVISRSILVRSK